MTVIEWLKNNLDSKQALELIDSEGLGVLNLKQVDSEDISQYYEVLFSIYGLEILLNRDIRFKILLNQEESTLDSLFNDFCRDNSITKKYDKALKLSLLPFNWNSEFTAGFADVLKVPREILPVKTTPPVQTKVVSKKNPLNPLHEYQENIYKKVRANLENRTKRFLIQMPTGSGKTRTSLESFIRWTNDQTSDTNMLWLAHTEELCEQAFNTFDMLWENYGNGTASISKLWGSFEFDVNIIKESHCFATYQKLTSLQKKHPGFFDQIKRNYSIVFVDEAHKTVASTYKDMINDLVESEKTTLIGLSATPGRSVVEYKENNSLSHFFNRELLQIECDNNVIDYLKSIGVLSETIFKKIKTGINIKLDKIDGSDDYFTDKKLKELAANQKRNNIIVETIKEEVDSGKQCIVFACSLQHSRVICAMLHTKGVAASFIDSTMRKTYRASVIKDFLDKRSMVIVNFEVLTTGFDAPNVENVFLTRPTSSIVLYSQMIGRGLRGPKMGGTKNCNIFEFTDNFSDFGAMQDIYDFFSGYWSYPKI